CKLNIHTFHSYALDNIEDEDILSSNLLRYAIYRKFKQVGKKSGWFLHFIRRKKYLTPLVHIAFVISKRRPSDKHIMKAWKRLTEALEKTDVYKTYFAKSSSRT
ncbi:hypothetical protein MEN24_18320, partial [Dolichospermum sp. ST_sed10]|nr:hypothetical protein [Dolichospermum sp. ST_sed10]